MRVRWVWAIVVATSIACSTNRPLAAPVYPRDLVGCYALYDSTGGFASKTLYFVPPFVELDSMPRVVNVSNYEQFGRSWSLTRLDSARRAMPQTFVPVPYGLHWNINATADSVYMAFTNGFSGTTFAFALAGVQRGKLRGVAREFSDGGPQERGPLAVSATRVECRHESSPPQEIVEWKGPPVDHVILAIDSLERGMEIFRQITGIRPVYGGVHPGRGTRDAIVSLGGARYLEITAPNPADTSQSGKERKDLFARFHRLTAYGWAVHTSNMDSTVVQLERSGFRNLKVVPGSRARPDGKLLKWRIMRPWGSDRPVLPFFIEWSNDNPHPSTDAPGGCALRRLSLGAADADSAGRMLIRAGIDVSVGRATPEKLYITIRCHGQDLPLY
jgi:hypothetical protein